MKKRVISLLAIISLLAACHKKAVPVISERKQFPDPPKSSAAVISDASPEFIAAGKWLYEGKCNRCHDLKSPAEYTEDRWHSILKLMIPRARMNSEQSRQVTAYLLTNAKK